MTSVSARIPDSLKEELDRFIEEEKLDRSTAVRKLLSEGIEEWKKQKALELLDSGEVSFSRAAEIADMDIWGFSSLVKDEKITWVKDERVREDLEAV
jgi:predicted HTH domain antitoxin